MSSNILTSELAICLWIPLFPLRCEERRRPELDGKPLALLAPTDTRRVWQVSPGARRSGVRHGMTVSPSIGLCPTLALLEPDPVFYDQQSTKLLSALESVSPTIEPVDLGRVFIGVDGLERLVGSAEAQIASVVAVLDGWERYARVGWGRGKFVAWLAATRAKPRTPMIVTDHERHVFIAKQPVAALPLSAPTHSRLRQLGLRSMSDVARLPETALVSQFGREGREAWRHAAGRMRDPVVGREYPEPIVATLHFPTPIADRGMLTHALKKLIQRALNDPRRSGWRVAAMRVQAVLEQGASWSTECVLKDPTADGEHLAAPLGVRLEQTPPPGAVEVLIVEFTAFVHGAQEFQLFARDAASAARAGQRQALRAAATEITHRLKRPLLYNIIEVQPWSRLPERRYALIDFEY